jgi:FKBP-type peptidyl-prolyl cis-trans isomerase FkpA
MKTLSKQEILTLVVTVVVIAGFVLYTSFRNHAKNVTTTLMDNSQSQQPQTPAPVVGANISTESRIKIIEVAKGTGTEAVAGKKVFVHYTGTFTTGQKFDSSLERGEPISFILGQGQVIKGWDIGIQGMKVGGKRHLEISSELGYGPNTYGPIPGGSTLLFDVELVDVK